MIFGLFDDDVGLFSCLDVGCSGGRIGILEP